MGARGNAVRPSAKSSETGQAGANRVTTSSVRAAVIDREPERAEPAAPLPLPLFSSHTAAVGKQPELVVIRSNCVVRIAKQVEPLRQVNSMGEGIRDVVLFL